MLVPLVGLFIVCAIFACIGTALLYVTPQFRPTLANVALFVFGAVPSCAVSAIAYGRVFVMRKGSCPRSQCLASMAFSWSVERVEERQPSLRVDGSCECCVSSGALAAQSIGSRDEKGDGIKTLFRSKSAIAI